MHSKTWRAPCASACERILILITVRACVDVDYRDTAACAAAVIFRDWPDAEAVEEKTVHVSKVAPYVPGELF